MRFPFDVTDQKRCPVCKKPGPGTDSPSTPRPETAAISLYVMSETRGRGSTVCLGSDLMFGWDSGVSKGPRSRASLGAAFTAARRKGEDPSVGLGLSVEFCSTRCLRQYLNDAVDELERRASAVEAEVRAARSKLDEEGA